MNHSKISTLCLTFLALTIACAVLCRSQPDRDPFAFFLPSVKISAEERARLDQGEPISHILQSSGNEVALVAAIRVKADGERLVEWVNQIAVWKKNPHVLAIGRFSNPPQIEDLAGLELDSHDMDAIRSCRPGKCELKISAAEMTQLQQAGGQSKGNSKTAVQQAFRQMILNRVQEYLTRGEIPPDEDHRKPEQPSSHFDSLLEHTPFLTDRLPQLAAVLKGNAASNVRGVQSFFYWSKEHLARKAMVGVTEVTIVRGHGPDMPDALIVGKDIFSSHYSNASLSVTAIVRGQSGQPNYLVYVNRTDLDVLHGVFEGVVRSVIEHHIKETSNVLEDFRSRLESGPPPASRP